MEDGLTRKHLEILWDDMEDALRTQRVSSPCRAALTHGPSKPWMPTATGRWTKKNSSTTSMRTWTP